MRFITCIPNTVNSFVNHQMRHHTYARTHIQIPTPKSLKQQQITPSSNSPSMAGPCDIFLTSYIFPFFSLVLFSSSFFFCVFVFGFGLLCLGLEISSLQAKPIPQLRVCLFRSRHASPILHSRDGILSRPRLFHSKAFLNDLVFDRLM